MDFIVRKYIGINTKDVGRVGTNNLLTETAGANDMDTKTVINSTNYLGTTCIKVDHILATLTDSVTKSVPSPKLIFSTEWVSITEMVPPFYHDHRWH